MTQKKPRRERLRGRVLELPATESLYEAIVQSAEDAIFTKSLDGTIASWNDGAERLYGYAASDIIGQKVGILAPPDQPDEIPALLARIAVGERIHHFETVRVRRDGSPVDVSLTISPIRDTNGRIVGASSVARDISARKTIEAELLQAQKLESIGRLAGGIAHDFNNMLFAIRGFADMLAEDLAPENRPFFDHEAALESVATINVAAERASVLTAQLLAFSRRQLVSPRSIDLNGSVEAIEPMLRRLIGADIRLTLALGAEIGAVLLDPGQLDQILVNLVVNARDAIVDGGAITVATHSVTFDEEDPAGHFQVAPGTYAQLTVSDTGVGMDRETREHIFEPFFTTKDVGKGTGLGLATIYAIVRQAGGHIWVYSEPAQGSTFKLYFPKHAADVTEALPEAGVRPTRREGTVMLVEDEETVRQMGTKLLERAGYRVLAMADGAAAQAYISEGRGDIDVLVTDVVMPGMSGIGLAQEMRARSPEVGLVLVSGYLAEALDLRALVALGALFVSKPVPSRDFLAAVDEAMARHRHGASDRPA